MALQDTPIFKLINKLINKERKHTPCPYIAQVMLQIPLYYSKHTNTPALQSAEDSWKAPQKRKRKRDNETV